MAVASVRNQCEIVSEHFGYLAGFVSRNRKTAAGLGSVRCKGCDDGMSPGHNRLGKGIQIGRAVRGIDKEMKHGPVMPQVVFAIGRPLGDVRGDPCHRVARRPQPVAGRLQRDRRQIKNRHVAQPLLQQGARFRRQCR